MSKTWTRKEFEQTHDPVNAPAHYVTGGIETIDFLRAKLGREGFVAYCRGNALKYLSRAGRKGDAREDFLKAEWYVKRAAEELRPLTLPPVKANGSDDETWIRGYQEWQGRGEAK